MNKKYETVLTLIVILLLALILIFFLTQYVFPPEPEPEPEPVPTETPEPEPEPEPDLYSADLVFHAQNIDKSVIDASIIGSECYDYTDNLNLGKLQKLEYTENEDGSYDVFIYISGGAFEISPFGLVSPKGYAAVGHTVVIYVGMAKYYCPVYSLEIGGKVYQ